MIVEEGRALCVELKSGEVVRARAVAANVTPSCCINGCSIAALPADFAEAIARTQVGSETFRINVALSELPNFSACPAQRRSRSRERHHVRTSLSYRIVHGTTRLLVDTRANLSSRC